MNEKKQKEPSIIDQAGYIITFSMWTVMLFVCALTGFAYSWLNWTTLGVFAALLTFYICANETADNPPKR